MSPPFGKLRIPLPHLLNIVRRIYTIGQCRNNINHGKEPFVIRDGDRIAQFLLMGVPKVEVFLCDTLDETARGEGGFGSTGV